MTDTPKEVKFKAWFIKQYGKRPSALPRQEVEDIERDAICQKFRLTRQQEWDSKFDVALKAWSVRTGR